ncbi:MAG: alpha/beta hydrolase [Pseudomonadota bacterium]
MFVITNRVIDNSASGLDKFGKHPNPSGPNELRLLKVTGTNRVEELADTLKPEEVEKLAKKYSLDINTADPWYQSLKVACELFDRSRREAKPVVLYVHGYNNDVGDILKSARDIEKLFKVIVVPFSWPANGGGAVSGTAAYLSDKDDARASSTALHRVVDKLDQYHRLLVKGMRSRAWKLAILQHPENIEAAKEVFDQKMSADCSSRVSLLCHSMGNYVMKHASLPSNSALRRLVFDNILMVAADVNNPGHAGWVENLPARNRLYVFINEEDFALKWSRRKPGEEQLARLGHHLKGLDAANAYYIDVSRNRGVGNSHAYFKGDPIRANATLKRVFQRAFEGDDADKQLTYYPDANVYRT